MKQLVKVPPTKTEVTVEINIPDSLVVTQSGGTPIDPIPGNLPPVVNAGANQVITLPTNSVILNGTGQDPDGTIKNIKWEKVSGGAVTIVNPTSLVTQVTGLVAGMYVFKLTLTDDDNDIASSTTNVEVKPAVVPVPTTPGAIEGYGALATGGEGKPVTRITNLSQLASAIGSNKTILIDVSGNINGNFNLSNVSNLTIDAYSTKQDVTITGSGSDGINIDNSNNVIIRGLRFKGFSNDGMNMTGSSSNIVFDHCSSYDNGDGNIDLVATSGKNFTVQWCIMGKNRGTGNMLGTTMNASIHHNLFIGDGSGEGAERNPFFHSNYSPKGTSSNPNFDFRNNLVHASGSYASGCGYGAVGNFVNNYYTSNKAGLIDLCADPASCSKAHVSGNFNQASPDGGSSSPEYTIPAQYRINITDAVTAGKAVLASVGPYKRDSYEQGVINSIIIGGTTPPIDPPIDPGGGYSGYTEVYSNSFSSASNINSNQLGRGGFSTFGGGSFRSEVRAGDAAISSGWRSEQQYGSNETPKEGIYEYEAYYENWGNFDGGGHSVQWHPYTGGASANISLQNYSLRWDVTRAIGSTVTHQNNAPAHVSNRWYKLRWEVRFSTGSDGYIKLFVDGVQTYSHTGKNDDGSGQYFKLGQNRWPDGNGNSMQKTSVCYYRNLKIYRKL